MGLPVICVETRHMRAVLKAQINKTDRNDARGIAQMMRADGSGSPLWASRSAVKIKGDPVPLEPPSA
jgi:transposase